VLLDEQSLQRKRARLSRYQTMSIDERREYNQKRRLKQLGLPENIEEVPRQKLEQIKRHINEVNARKAEAARQRYHRMVFILLFCKEVWYRTFFHQKVFKFKIG